MLLNVKKKLNTKEEWKTYNHLIGGLLNLKMTD